MNRNQQLSSESQQKWQHFFLGWFVRVRFVQFRVHASESVSSDFYSTSTCLIGIRRGKSITFCLRKREGENRRRKYGKQTSNNTYLWLIFNVIVFPPICSLFLHQVLAPKTAFQSFRTQQKKNPLTQQPKSRRGEKNASLRGHLILV